MRSPIHHSAKISRVVRAGVATPKFATIVTIESQSQNAMERGAFATSKLHLKSLFSECSGRLKLKRCLQHVGLLIILMGYTVLGGLIFRSFEHPAEVAKQAFLNETIQRARKNLIESVVNNSQLTNLGVFVSVELKHYEKLLRNAFNEGFPNFPPKQDGGGGLGGGDETEKWSTLKSVFFSSTVLTTIGYGNIVPVTTGGRAFCIVFALVGIPLTLTVIADWGRLFATAVSGLMKQIPPLPRRFRNATVARRTSSYAFSAVCFLFVYLGAGAGLFVIWEEDWTFFDGFYFCFITMTTIGFGDLVPKKPKYMLLCTLYILVGLALTSTIIELVRRQYAQSWRQLQALSGPLAENLRKLAENAPGLDVTAFQQDLRKVLTVVTMSKRPTDQVSKAEKRRKQLEWEQAMEAVIRDITESAKNKQTPTPIVQIVIYESSV